MSSESGRELSMHELLDRNRKPVSNPPQTLQPPTHITVECPASREQLEVMDRMLVELRRMNALLSELPTREDAAAMQKTLERMLEAAQPPAKPAGRKSANRSSRIWPAVRDWLADRLPTPSWTWLAAIPLGGAVFLAWYCANLLMNGVSQILS